MLINIQGTGIELTEALREYAEKRAQASEKYFDNIQQIDIDIGRLSKHHNKGQIFYAEANVHIPGKLVRVTEEAEDLYEAIDHMKNGIKAELEKVKGKMRTQDRKQLRDHKAYGALEA